MRVGMLLYGFCSGYFGRDSYEDKRVEAVGNDWIVVREAGSGRPDFASFDDHARLEELCKEWSVQPKKDQEDE